MRRQSLPLRRFSQVHKVAHKPDFFAAPGITRESGLLPVGRPGDLRDSTVKTSAEFPGFATRHGDDPRLAVRSGIDPPAAIWRTGQPEVIVHGGNPRKDP